MARNDPQVNFRIPSALKDRLDLAAHENGRTLTAELIIRLESTFEKDDQFQDLFARLEKLEEAVQYLESEQASQDRRMDDIEGGLIYLGRQ